jgi:formyltetrahydrofolate deformylase
MGTPPGEQRAYVLTFKARDRLGLMALVANALYDNGAFVEEVSHFGDQDTRTYMGRVVFDDRSMSCPIEEFREAFAGMARDVEMEFSLRPVDQRKRVLIAVSGYNHCLNVLLTKWHSDVLPIDLVGVVSNHETCRDLVEFYGLPFHYLPISPQTKPQQEQQVLDLIETESVDLLVLARYMQILSDGMCARLEGRAINIHHSFLPGFKGARPYHQAHERGVKVIGATAHYVTADLDEGPIIVQEVKPIDHTYRVQDMVNLGHDIESTALARAVQLHVEDRVILNGARTVIL